MVNGKGKSVALYSTNPLSRNETAGPPFSGTRERASEADAVPDTRRAAPRARAAGARRSLMVRSPFS